MSGGRRGSGSRGTGAVWYARGVYLVEGGEVGRVDLIAAVDVTRAEEGLLALVRVRVRVRVRLGLGLG